MRLEPGHAKAHFARGRALYLLSDFGRAFWHYERGLEAEPRPAISTWLAREQRRAELAVADAAPSVLRRRVEEAVRVDDSKALSLLLQRCSPGSLQFAAPAAAATNLRRYHMLSDTVEPTRWKSPNGEGPASFCKPSSNS